MQQTTTTSMMSTNATIASQVENNNISSMPPLNVALLGSGIFATNSHAPILRDNPSVFNCIGVWSRKFESAFKLASTFNDAKSYTDLDELLKLPELEAIIMALPLDVQPEYVLKCLDSNKHVLSEKPVAPTIAEGTRLLDTYKEKYAHLKWSVAENFRYEPGIQRVADIIQNKDEKVSIGKPHLVNLEIRAPFLPDNKYLLTQWRKEPSWYGGLFIDAFVHASAMLRLILGNAQSVSALTSSNSDYIPGIDTMCANISWPNEINGCASVTYFCTEVKFNIEIVGSGGKLTLSRKTDGPGYKIQVFRNSSLIADEEFGYGGLHAEFFAFAQSCRGNGIDCNNPVEALNDLAFVEACLESGKKKGEMTSVEQF